MRIRIILFIFFISFLTHVKAQSDSTKFTDNLFVSVTYGNGILMAHRASLKALINDYTYYTTIEIGTATYGKRPWESLFKYPMLGVGIYRGANGNNNLFGHTTALYGFVSSPYHNEKQVSFGYKFGGGMAYVEKPFDIDQNIYNIVIGSHLNVYIHLAFDLKLKLFNDKVFINTGLGFTHQSNGKIQTPNLGFNILDLHFTAAYFLGKQSKKIYKAFPQRKKHTFVGVITGGAKEYNEPNLGKFFAGSIILDYEYSVMKKSSWGAGLDFFYDGIIHDKYKTEQNSRALMHAGRFGAHLGYVFNYNKVGFIVQLGSYINPYYNDISILYSRIGIRAKVSKHLIANITMKTHYAKADIVEFGLAYYFSL